MLSPKASTYSDLELVKVLKKYDEIKSFTISDLDLGDALIHLMEEVLLRGKKKEKISMC